MKTIGFYIVSLVGKVIVNKSGINVYIQLSVNSRNMDSETRKRCDEINEIVTMKQKKKEWLWWKLFKSSKITIPENIDKDSIYRDLDDGLDEVKRFEDKLMMNMGG